MKWLNCSESENTWEPRESLTESHPEEVDDFEKKWQAAYDEAHEKKVMRLEGFVSCHVKFRCGCSVIMMLLYIPQHFLTHGS